MSAPSASKSTSVAACRRSPSSASATPPSARPGSACARRCRTPASSFRCRASSPTSRPRICARGAPGFDLAIACGVLAASGQVPTAALERRAVFGELSLTGALRPCHGTLAVAEGARRPACAGSSCARETRRGGGARRRPRGRRRRAPARGRRDPATATTAAARCPTVRPPAVLAPSRTSRTSRDVRGHAAPDRGAADRGGRRPQPPAARAAGHRQDDARPAAAGDPPAADARRRRSRSRASTRSPGCTAAAGSSSAGRFARRTTRSRRRASSAAARVPAPGEASLAHHGVLFLDELSEFTRCALEALRQPLEDGRVGDRPRPAHRGLPDAGSCSSPRRTRVRAASRRRVGPRCRCSESDLSRHARRLSGPLLDRLDLARRRASGPTPALSPAPPGDRSETCASG